MNDFEWWEKFFADQMEKAWASFREKLAEDFLNCFDELSEIEFVEDEDVMLAFDDHDLVIVAPNGWDVRCSFYRPEEDIYLVEVRQQNAQLQREISGQNELVEFNSTSAREAANLVAELFRNDWGVVHPSFLKLSRNPEIAGSQNIPDNHCAGEPTEGFAQSEGQLRHWVSTALIDWNPSILTGTKSGNFRIDTKEGLAVGIYVHTPEIVEICVNVADDLDEEIAKAALLEILSVQSPFKYFLTEQGIIMSSFVNCVPFTKDLFLRMLEYHIKCTELMSEQVQEAILEARKSVARESKKRDALISELATKNALVEDLQNEKQEADIKIEVLRKQRDWAKQRLSEQIEELRAQLDAKRDKYLSDVEAMQAEKKALKSIISELEFEIQEMREAEFKWIEGSLDPSEVSHHDVA